MTVNFRDAQPGDISLTWDWPFSDEFGWVSDIDYFHDELIDPVTVTRKRWKLVAIEQVTFHPTTELCPRCHGDEEVLQYPEHLRGGTVALDTVPGYDPRVMAPCPTCKNDPGRHPLAGQQEVHDGTP